MSNYPLLINNSFDLINISDDEISSHNCYSVMLIL